MLIFIKPCIYLWEFVSALAATSTGVERTEMCFYIHSPSWSHSQSTYPHVLRRLKANLARLWVHITWNWPLKGQGPSLMSSGWAQLAVTIARLFMPAGTHLIQQGSQCSYRREQMSSSKDMSIDSSFASLLHLLSFLRQGFSPSMKGISSTDRLWMQAFQWAGHQAAFLPELKG